MPRKSCKSKRRNKKYSKRCSKKISIKYSRRRSRKYSRRRSRKYSRRKDGMNGDKLLTEPIPRDIDKYEMDIELEPLKTTEEDEYIDYKEYLEPLLYDSDVETIPDEYLTEYKSLKPPDKFRGAFNRVNYRCNYCREDQYSRDNLITHILTVHKKPVYICEEPTCNYTTSSNADLKKHSKTHDIYECPYCDFKDNKRLVNRHIKTHLKT